LVKLVVSFLLGRRFLGQTAGISIELDHPEVICLLDTRLCSSPIALEAIVADCMTGQWSTSPLLGPVALSDTFGAAVTTVDSARCETTVRLTPGWWLADRTIEGEVLRDLLTEAFGHLAHIERRNESLEIELRANTNAVLAIDRSVCSFCGLPPDSDRPLVVGPKATICSTCVWGATLLAGTRRTAPSEATSVRSEPPIEKEYEAKLGLEAIAPLDDDVWQYGAADLDQVIEQVATTNFIRYRSAILCLAARCLVLHGPGRFRAIVIEDAPPRQAAVAALAGVRER
jgi:hypothetical protein